MNIETFIQSMDIYNHSMAVLLGMPRLFMLAMVVPFLGSAVVTGQLRLTLVGSLYLVLHPMVFYQLQASHVLGGEGFNLYYGFLLAKESLIGLVLGFLGGLVFWTIQGAGFFIDNQRGASQAEGADPLSGEQASVTGGLLFQSMVYLFFVSGAFLTFMGVVYASYEVWPVTQMLPLHLDDIHIPLYFASCIGWMMTYVLLLAGPITVACLLTDVSLGLMNRFASQLNVYVLAMPIKSGVASFLLCFYFGLLLHKTPMLFQEINRMIIELKAMMV